MSYKDTGLPFAMIRKIEDEPWPESITKVDMYLEITTSEVWRPVPLPDPFYTYPHEINLDYASIYIDCPEQNIGGIRIWDFDNCKTHCEFKFFSLGKFKMDIIIKQKGYFEFQAISEQKPLKIYGLYLTPLVETCV